MARYVVIPMNHRGTVRFRIWDKESRNYVHSAYKAPNRTQSDVWEDRDKEFADMFRDHLVRNSR